MPIWKRRSQRYLFQASYYCKIFKSHDIVNYFQLSVSAKLPSGNEYSLELDLTHPIITEECSYKVLSSTIEIKLKKRDGIRWNALEGNPVEQNVIQPIPNGML